MNNWRKIKDDFRIKKSFTKHEFSVIKVWLNNICMMNKVWMKSKLRMSDECIMNKVWMNSNLIECQMNVWWTKCEWIVN